MRFGCCIADAAGFEVAARAGADYVELPVATRVMGADERALEDLARRAAEGPPALAANVFLPPDLALVGPSVDQARLDAYVEEALRRLQRLGVRLLVLGSGGARRIPEGYDRERALEELAWFCRRTADKASGAGVTLVLEPLRSAESNVWNSVEEAAGFVRSRQLPGVTVLADLYHMREERESVDAVTENADLLAHVHVAGLHRGPPSADPELARFLALAARARSDIGCSIECRWSDFATEVGPALAAVRQAAGSPPA